ncbi:MAG TPA: PemK family protein [Candidatus Omnitrophica bacterium]|nr:PemK family protein [Candidatus Omnitrophota bacterium]HCI43937.1 PemK family protein [Candidatus Omnitrophota bacterium]
MDLVRGDIVLVPFPFTDLTSSKVRPAVIVSADPQPEDITIAFISSVLPHTLAKTEFLLTSKDKNFAASGLKKDSVFKMGKLLTVSSSLIVRRLGRATVSLQKELDVCLAKAVGLA